uniref:Ion_trans domain-containing protein n=1 Tax=Syphacia muris TaxID=451379 RepID=A0A0N5ARV2_9BILA
MIYAQLFIRFFDVSKCWIWWRIMLSELVVAITLSINALAILNFKLKKSADPFSATIIEGEPLSVGERIREFLFMLQYFRVFIGLWNIFVFL